MQVSPSQTWSSSPRGCARGWRRWGRSFPCTSALGEAGFTGVPLVASGGRHRHQQSVNTEIVGELGVKRAGEDPAVTDRHRMAVDGREDLYAVAVGLDPGRADEDRPQRVRADAGQLQVGLEARDLGPERVAANGRVDSPRWSRSQTIIPAQGPRMGRPSAAWARIAGPSPSRSIAFVIVVDSPPGITRASRSASSSAVRTSTARPRAPAASARAPRIHPGWPARRLAGGRPPAPGRPLPRATH